jgi:hypothetical protein
MSARGPKKWNLSPCYVPLNYRICFWQAWLTDAEHMATILEDCNKSAQQMTSHGDADIKYAAYKKRLLVILATAKEWIDKFDKMVAVWKRQAETADKVTAAMSQRPDPEKEGGGLMKLEDLEGLLNGLKSLFIEKQKMMEDLEKTACPPAPEAATAAAT